MVGFADVTNSLVEAFGRSGLFSGLTAGARHYLSGTTAGAITVTAPLNKVFIGIAKSATTIFVDIDPDNSIDPIPIGSVSAFSASVPSGWIDCDGSAISRTSYASLFSEIGTLYGVGDGSTTFNIPDLRGEFIRGYDNGRGVDSARVLGSSQPATAIRDQANNNLGVAINNGENPVTSTVPYGGVNPTANRGVFYDVKPRNIAMIFCIKY